MYSAAKPENISLGQFSVIDRHQFPRNHFKLCPLILKIDLEPNEKKKIPIVTRRVRERSRNAISRIFIGPPHSYGGVRKTAARS